MAFSKLNLFIFSIVILVQMSSAAIPVDFFKPVTYQCPTVLENENFTIGSQYEKNLDLVLYNLSIMTPTTGFGYGSAGVVKNIDLIYGRAQCRPDVSIADCTTCVGKIARWIRKKCPVQKSAFAWFQGCQFMYSGVDFYGKIPEDLEGCFVQKIQNLSRIVPAEKLQKFLVGLSEKAHASEKLFAKGVTKLTATTNLYGLVECTQDASHEVCKTCLDLLIKISTTVAYGQGTQFYQTVCTMQYSFYPFFRA